MKDAIFILEKGTKKWRYNEFVILRVENQRWKMGKDNVFQTYESVYDVISELSKCFNLHSTFKVPDDLFQLAVVCSI